LLQYVCRYVLELYARWSVTAYKANLSTRRDAKSIITQYLGWAEKIQRQRQNAQDWIKHRTQHILLSMHITKRETECN